MIVFKHWPKLGDVIYSLPFIRRIKENTKGRPCYLALDPKSPYFYYQQAEWTEKFKSLAPFIKRQEYICGCDIYDKEKVKFNLDKYMKTSHLTIGDTVTIVENHFNAFKLKIEERDFRPWLVAETHLEKKTFCIANSMKPTERPLNFKKILEHINPEDAIFVGTSDEWEKFSIASGTKWNNIKTGDITELAAAINSCDIFIGNQSLPLAIAQGLGKKCFVEQHTKYPNAMYQNCYDLNNETLIVA